LIPKVEAAIETTIISLVKRGVTTFYNGGSYGFDLLSAEKVIVLKTQRNLPIKLIMVLPCKGHDVKWSDDNKARLLNVLNNADETICLSERYYDGCMKARNNYLIEHSDICVAYMTYGRSGSSQTVRLAREKGLEVINLAEN
jgi:uncharacterized phage-like protein YoqJ